MSFRKILQLLEVSNQHSPQRSRLAARDEVGMMSVTHFSTR